MCRSLCLVLSLSFFCPSVSVIYSLSLHDALPISGQREDFGQPVRARLGDQGREQRAADARPLRSEEHTSELQSHSDLVCRLLLEKKKPTLLGLAPAVANRDHE